MKTVFLFFYNRIFMFPNINLDILYPHYVRSSIHPIDLLSYLTFDRLYNELVISQNKRLILLLFYGRIALLEESNTFIHLFLQLFVAMVTDIIIYNSFY